MRETLFIMGGFLAVLVVIGFMNTLLGEMYLVS